MEHETAHFSFQIHESLHGQLIALQSETADNAYTSRSDIRVVTKGLALMHIADMHLYHRALQRAHAIVQRDAGVSISARVEHHAVIRKTHFLQFIDQRSLAVALEVFKLYVGKLGA